MSGFNLEAALDGLRALMLTIPELQAVNIGGPESLSVQVEGWVTLGDPENVGSNITGTFDLPVNLIAWFGYTVAGAEENAERKLAQYVAELVRRLIQNRMHAVDGVTLNLNGSATYIGLPRPAAGAADYATMAGQELRVWPCGILVTQRENIS